MTGDDLSNVNGMIASGHDMYRLDSHHRSASGRGVLTLTFSDMDELLAAAQRDRPPLASAACKVIITALGGVTN